MIGWVLRRIVRITTLLLLSPLFLLRGLLDRVVGQDVLVLRLSEEVRRFPQQDPAWRRFLFPRKSERLSLSEALVGMAEVERSEAIKGVVLELDRAELSLAQAEELLNAIDRVKASGKKVLVWADGMGGPALVVAAAADAAYSVPEGQLYFFGVRVRAVFVHDLMHLLGVVPELDHHGDYKTFSDMFMRQTMSPAHEEMSRDLGGDIYEQIITPLIVGRGLPRDTVTATLDAAPVSTRQAVEAGFLSGAAYRDETLKRSGQLLGLETGKKPSTCSLRRLMARRGRREWLGSVLHDARAVRVLDLNGAIISGESGRGCPSLAAVKAMDEAREDRHVAAVVLRINSPGGSAIASDEMWRAAKRLDAKKPLVASLGDVAASGGYYLAVGARKIVAHAATLVGSIGVVSGKYHLAPALFRWGVRMEGVSFGARAGMYDPHRGFTPEEAQANHAGLMRFYETFLERVAEGRGMTRDAVDAIAQGRVYTGRRGQALGLVDTLGGLGTAIDLAGELAGLKRAPQLQLVVPNKPSLREQLDPRPKMIAPLAQSLEALTLALTLSREPALAYCAWRVDGV